MVGKRVAGGLVWQIISDSDAPRKSNTIPPRDAPNVMQALVVFNNGLIERKRKDEPAMMFSRRPTGIPFLLLAIVLGCLTGVRRSR